MRLTGAAIVGTSAGWVGAIPLTLAWYAGNGHLDAWARDLLTPAHVALLPASMLLAVVVLVACDRTGWSAAPAPWGPAIATALASSLLACLLGAAWGGGYGLAWMAYWALLSGYGFFVFAFTAMSCRSRAATR